MKSCPNCGAASVYRVRNVAVTRSRINAALSHCSSCDYLFLADPCWLGEAYQDEFYGDTGYVARNIDISNKTIVLFRAWKLISCRRSFPPACDIGAGLGVYARTMRDKGYEFYGVDEYARMPLIKPFVGLGGEGFKVKTAFEVVEHVPSLPAFLLENVGKVDLFFFSTTLRGVGSIPDSNWGYYAFGSGQHIGFHSKKSLAAGFCRAGYDAGCLMSYGSWVHALAVTEEWKNAFSIAKCLWRTQGRIARVPGRLLSRVFGETSLTYRDYLHAARLLDHSPTSLK